jgi:hypothetical protein
MTGDYEENGNDYYQPADFGSDKYFDTAQDLDLEV